VKSLPVHTTNELDDSTASCKDDKEGEPTSSTNGRLQRFLDWKWLEESVKNSAIFVKDELIDMLTHKQPDGTNATQCVFTACSQIYAIYFAHTIAIIGAIMAALWPDKAQEINGEIDHFITNRWSKLRGWQKALGLSITTLCGYMEWYTQLMPLYVMISVVAWKIGAEYALRQMGFILLIKCK